MCTLRRPDTPRLSSKGLSVCETLRVVDARCGRIRMLCKLGTFVEYSVFAKEVSLDWTIIGDTKGWWCRDST